MKVWVVKHDDHDYDFMSEWWIGAFSSEELAKEASEKDCRAYWKVHPGSKKRGLPNTEIVELTLDEVVKE